LKVFINPFFNALTLLSQTLAKTEIFGYNLNTVEEKENKYIYPNAVYLSHEKFLSNADPDLNENNVGTTVRAKNSMGRRSCIHLFTPLTQASDHFTKV